jgi:hypothetical protein
LSRPVFGLVGLFCKQVQTMAIDKQRLDKWFSNKALPVSDKTQNHGAQEIRMKARALADAIVANTPASADQSDAIRKVREAMQVSFQSIVCE